MEGLHGSVCVCVGGGGEGRRRGCGEAVCVYAWRSPNDAPFCSVWSRLLHSVYSGDDPGVWIRVAQRLILLTGKPVQVLCCSCNIVVQRDACRDVAPPTNGLLVHVKQP